MLRTTTLLTLLSLSLAAQEPAKAATPKAEAKPAAASKAETKPASKAEAPKAEAKPVDKIIAMVGTTYIRQSEVDAAMATLPPQQKQQMQMMAGAREMYVKSYVEMKLLAAKSRLMGVDKSDAFKQKLAGATDQLLASELLSTKGPELQKKMEMKDEDLKAYFEAHKDKFMAPGKFSARHILVSVKSDRNPNGLGEEEAKAKVAKLQAELKAGKKMEDLAKEYSDDPGSKDKGGLYENISFGQFVPEFEKAVKEQELGKAGEPVKTPFGYHVIQAEKVDQPKAETFEEAKDKVRAEATKERQEQVWSAFLNEIKKDVPYQFGEISEAAAPVKSAKASKPATKKAAAGTAK